MQDSVIIDEMRRDQTSLLSQVPAVAVIMSTYNGEKYLREQIDSILAQKDVHVELFIRDDGSTDGTREIISDYVNRYNNIHADYGTVNMGWIRSFIHELGAVPDFDYYAMSDQDDIWLEEKLVTACKAIQQEENAKGRNTPIIWQSNAYVTDEKLNILYKTKREKRLKTIYSLAMRPSGLGCCMVMNARAREFTRHKNKAELFSCRGYDVALVLLTVASGGSFITEHDALVKYRQHSHNVVGIPISVMRRIKIEYTRLTKWYKREAKFAEIALKYFNNEMTPDAKKAFTLIAGCRKNWLYRIAIILSPKFRTGYIGVTLLEKFRALAGFF